MVLDYLVDTWDYRSEVLHLLKDRCYKKGDFTLSSGRKTQQKTFYQYPFPKPGDFMENIRNPSIFGAV